MRQKQGGATLCTVQLSANSCLAAPLHETLPVASRAMALPNPSWLTAALYVAPPFLSHVRLCQTCRHPFMGRWAGHIKSNLLPIYRRSLRRWTTALMAAYYDIEWTFSDLKSQKFMKCMQSLSFIGGVFHACAQMIGSLLVHCQTVSFMPWISAQVTFRGKW